MISNRSVPADAVLPHILYRDVEQAISWLSRAFGFRERRRLIDSKGRLSHGELEVSDGEVDGAGDGLIMLASPTPATPRVSQRRCSAPPPGVTGVPVDRRRRRGRR